MKYTTAVEWSKAHGLDIDSDDWPDKMSESLDANGWVNFHDGNSGCTDDLRPALEALEKIHPGLEFEMMDDYAPPRGPFRIISFPKETTLIEKTMKTKPNTAVDFFLRTKFEATYEGKRWEHPIFGEVEAHIYTGTKEYVPVVQELEDDSSVPEKLLSLGYGVYDYYLTLEEAMKGFDKGSPRPGNHYWEEAAHIYFDGNGYSLLYV